MEIEKLIKLEDFCNKKIIYSDEVLEALSLIDGLDFKSILKSNGIKIDEHIHSLFVDRNMELLHNTLGYSGTVAMMNDCFYDESFEQEMHYSKEKGFYVEVEDE